MAIPVLLLRRLSTLFIAGDRSRIRSGFSSFNGALNKEEEEEEIIILHTKIIFESSHYQVSRFSSRDSSVVAFFFASILSNRSRSKSLSGRGGTGGGIATDCLFVKL